MKIDMKIFERILPSCANSMSRSLTRLLVAVAAVTGGISIMAHRQRQVVALPLTTDLPSRSPLPNPSTVMVCQNLSQPTSPSPLEKMPRHIAVSYTHLRAHET